MPIAVQMANIGSEAERAISWKEKGRPDYAGKSLARVMQMLELAISGSIKSTRLKELTRLREILTDYLAGANLYRTGVDFWSDYFGYFYKMARRGV